MAKQTKRPREFSKTMMLDVFQPAWSERLDLPLYGEAVAAGFPAPAQSDAPQILDLNSFLVHRPEATFLVRVTGESMKDAGILDGDLLVVDAHEIPVDGKIVLAMIHGEYTLKRIRQRGKKLMLMPENKSFKPIEIKPGMDVEIRGVVRFVIHKV